MKLKLILISLSLLTLSSCLKKEVKLSAKEELGKKLYFEPRVSVDGTISCNSCHNVMNYGVDGRAVSAGVQGLLGGRNSPTVFNAGFLSTQFWDGRAKNLKEQAKGPMINPVEMGNSSHDLVITRLAKIPGYQKEFKEVFKEGENSLNIENAAEAIAAYEKTLTTLNSPYDTKTMTPEQTKGFETFKGIGCTACHSGEHFAGPKLPEGEGFFQKFPTFEGSEYESKYKLTDDLGRFKVTLEQKDKHLFRVPTLRNVEMTAPYFHNGTVNSLDEAVRVMAKTQLNRDLTDQEVKEIVTFLGALTGTIKAQTLPELPPTKGTSLVGEM